LSTEGGGSGRQMLAAGVIVSLVCTILLAWALVRFSARLPLRTIFGATSIVMIAMAIVLAGKGARAFQEMGTLPATQIGFGIRLDLLGIFPTVETLVSQALIAALAAVLWFRARAQSAPKLESV
jgi:high-affinity iron transporter